MTASPEPSEPIETSYKFPARLLTIAEYQQLGEIEFGYTELQEGHILLSPSPVPDHNTAMFELGFQLRGQVPAQFEVIPDMDVDLELDGPDQPGLSPASLIS